ncbi:XRE family transcriptional regulator [Streptomyces sp. TRM68367]|uniref:helix-turn-helix domain-containing protein n=1 Tax=Streptomyces sp. TRM68367 TaxID=2758415 RepID=UPI00165B6C7F|nr:XRE family transcriptional regulator [Streptomyces sp. TRM68367]MBC9731337.1 XRE family transcriptional regulator [Streptomyces sp. TRM68367]
MPRWRALPDELDPQIEEFTTALRRLVDRSELSIAAMADATGYSKTSWERYLNGRLLAPKGAIVALAEVTGTNPVHLTTLWELAERSWSRSEMRHDMTMEAIRISQARAALGELGGSQADGKGGRAAARKGGRSAAAVTPGIAGPAGVAPTVPPQPTAPEVRDAVVRDTGVDGARDGAASSGNSWGVAAYHGAAGGALGAPGSGVPGPGGPGRTPAPVGSYGEPPLRDARPSRGGDSGGKRRAATFLAAAVGVLVVIAGAFYLTDVGGDDNKGAAAPPSPSVSSNPDLPAGVKCSGESCTGKDAESMGCSGDLVTTAKTGTVGTAVVEVRYSETCRAAWGRITGAAQGDAVQVTAGKAKQDASISAAGDTIAYTPMVAVKGAGEAKACAALASGEKGCTE